MLKLVKNQNNRIGVSVSSTIDLTGFSAKVTVNGSERKTPSLIAKDSHFDFTASDVDSLGVDECYAPIDILKPDGSVYTNGLVSMKAVDTATEAVGSDKIYLVIVGDISSPMSGESLEAEAAARKEADIEVLANAKAYTDDKIMKSKLFVYAGQVDTAADLPETAEIGEVYNVVDTGANYAWSGTDWDKLSENIDLSAFATTSQLNEETEARTSADEALRNTLAEETNTRKSQVENLTNLIGANSTAIAGLNESVALKADKTAVESLQAEVGTLSTSVASKASKADLEAMETTVGTKASQSDLSALEAKVGEKANASDLTNLATTVGTKASQESLDALATTVGGKASNERVDGLAETLTNVESTVSTKAAQSDLEALETAVNGKASSADLEAVSANVDTKASSAEVEAISTTVNGVLNGLVQFQGLLLAGPNGHKYRLSVTLVDSGDGSMEPTLSVVEEDTPSPSDMG